MAGDLDQGDDATRTSLPYHEPGVSTILLQASFLILLNAINSILDRTLYCGLIGQVLLGIAFGTPGAKWLGIGVEEVIVQLGYLGLLLLVFEGGLSTSFKSLKANILLSSGIAVTGIALPMGLSFSLTRLAGASSLQAFAAGAALCSTSLGTTFTVLATSGLTSSRLGVVLTSAAMMDDVVGLVMVQVVSDLGRSGGMVDAVTIARPIAVSLGIAIVVPLVCGLVVKPVTRVLNETRKKNPAGRLHSVVSRQETVLVVHVLILLSLIAVASYAGSSNLLAAYVAGASISWWDSEMEHVDVEPTQKADVTNTSGVVSESSPALTPKSHLSGVDIFHTYFYPSLHRVLKPLFFASIGFSIPITQMFSRDTVWRGVIYTLLMAIAKLACGLWLLRIPFSTHLPPKVVTVLKRISLPKAPHFWGASREQAERTEPDTTVPAEAPTETAQPAQPTPTTTTQEQTTHPSLDHLSPSPSRPISLYPASILGCAMVARGEIGFLISSIAESNGIFSTPEELASPAGQSSKIFLIVTWAIVLCTIIGPLMVGLLVRRVKKLEGRAEKQGRNVRAEVLGVWGVE